MFKGRIIAGAVAAGLLLSCGHRQEEKAEALGPEDTVVNFIRAVAAGDFARSRELCDTMTMNGYISRYMQAWDMLSSTDSVSAGIAREIISNTEIIIEDVARENDRRTVHCIIELPEGMRKAKTVAVRKEDGKWKVEDITDRR